MRVPIFKSNLKIFLLPLGLVLLSALIWAYAADWFDTPQPTRFAVISDPHVYDTRLGTTGSAFAENLASDVKMVVESGALLESAVSLLAAQQPKPAFLLIPGDLTHEGEKTNHLLMASYLADLRAKGIQPYVIPGNHDIDNPSASHFDQHRRLPAQRINAREFAEIYAPFGYQQAIARDPDSLSYIAEPVPGYWLFAIDSCRYGEGKNVRIDAGRIRPETLNWILSKLAEARNLGKQPLGMLHHGVLEHSLGQAHNFSDFVLENGDNTGRALAAAGLQLVFTGHSHTQNITRKAWQEDRLLDVQTGSLVTYPNPLRVVTLDPANNALSIRSIRIMDIPAATTSNQPGFAASSHAFTSTRHTGMVSREMTQRTSLSLARQTVLSRQIVTAIMASHAGDEKPTLRQFHVALKLRNSANPDEITIGKLMLSLWHDLPPNDNNIDLMLDNLLASSEKPPDLDTQRQAAR